VALYADERHDSSGFGDSSFIRNVIDLLDDGGVLLGYPK
jgi:hypothetical protein